MTELLRPRAMGSDVARLEGWAKVTGTAPYAYEHPVDNPAHAHALQASIARGRITGIDTAAARELPGVLAVLTHENAPALASTEDGELAILQSGEVHYRGQLIGAVIAENPEIARHAAALVRVDYEQAGHDAEFSAERDDLHTPEQVNPAFATDTAQGDLEAAFESAPVRVDATYTTPMEHNNPMEPHTTVAVRGDGGLTLHDSTQGAHTVRQVVAKLFGLDRERVRVVSPHVGGGFGSKGLPHSHVVLAVMAAGLLEGRPVKLALTRQQMFSLTGHRTPTVQRIRLGADRDGRLTAIAHDVIEQSSKVKIFAEQSAEPSRHMYAAGNRRTTHRLALLDVPVPSWMRAPGECPGMFAGEVAMDELAVACGLDPVELRLRNEPETDPESGKPFSSRNLVACLREGVRRFGWQDRDPEPGVRREDGWLVGTGVASAVYPANVFPGSAAAIRRTADGYQVRIGAADIGTGTWTALSQIAADALGVGLEEIDLRIGDTELPHATVAGGSSGLSSWGSAVVDAAAAFREKFGTDPSVGDEADGTVPDNPDRKRYEMKAFGAQFAEVRVREDTGEVRVPRMLGVFAAGRIVNPRTARSQFVGGMTMGISMALHEQSVLDPRFGHVVNHDFAEYHVATNADVHRIDVHWLDEHDPHVNPVGTKGIGEIGIVGAAAAVANAAYHATGLRVRELPITPDRFLG
ncbi:xanthine dehydrogenase family protein molybdopterin-binding subunit [Saccharopolyspora erythraea]|uniref:xanthine dehydrogenase family protein molybdopterin-binding subunit n=1 Tax=Saccharopolyspora erythraea TaxID=1836 RepID=UPI001BA7D5F7|nr:xanthine dehydrogenase family protein molybdopterin-binding subunit [Saccharopolyspora erythraea]QUH03392.1 xanthine dehydrogenase family protein molybdopterin-binding subunit [Saccharopolyspora erythraea]